MSLKYYNVIVNFNNKFGTYLKKINILALQNYKSTSQFIYGFVIKFSLFISINILLL